MPIGLAGMVLGQEAAQGQIFDRLRSLVGDEGGKNTAVVAGVGTWMGGVLPGGEVQSSPIMKVGDA